MVAIYSVHSAAITLGVSAGKVEKTASKLGITPAFLVDGVRYFKEKQLTQIGAAIKNTDTAAKAGAA